MYADLTLPFKTLPHALFEGKVKHVPAKSKYVLTQTGMRERQYHRVKRPAQTFFA
jgi:hypothetical protein